MRIGRVAGQLSQLVRKVTIFGQQVVVIRLCGQFCKDAPRIIELNAILPAQAPAEIEAKERE
jgi:hypothetical protein